ncbi:MAG: FG-GAP-like repeat-containing protein, partial [Verrucomicrobiota bacterium]
IEDSVPHTSWFSMGADFGDLNSDGLLDFLVADMSGSNHYKQKTAMGAMSASAEFLATAEPRQYMRNALYLGTGVNNYFREAAYLSGLSDTDWTWTVKVTDLNNDGLNDVYFTNGMSKNFNVSDGDALDIRVGETQWDRHVRAKTPPLNEQNMVFQNKGNLKMEEVGKEWGLDDVGMSFGSVHSDLDRDGDLDLVVVNLDRPVTIYRNDSESGNSVLFQLKGKKSNPAGIGARIDLVADGKEQKRQISIMRGYMGSHEAIAHFGLGEAATIEKVTIHWPSGIEQTLENLPVNQFHVIEESGSPAGKPARAERQQFLAVTSLNKVMHEENEFDDFIRQPLLPNKMSQFGPGVAVGDVDGDGDEDFVLSGARGFATTLCLNDGKGNFTSRPATPDVAYEDQGVLLFEADGDGDLDLYVVSGGSEADARTPGMQDRLYMNDGKGNFLLNKTGLPDMSFSGGTVAAGDVDRDGDLDLFVGGRQVPGAYPLGPESRLLRNEGGRFVDATDQAFRQLGMVTGAVFSDADNNGWVDLVVCSEWGPVQVLANRNGSFSPLPQTDPPTGWWTGLTSGDLNQDGHVDYIATNIGLNTKYHASPKTPALGYYGDFDGTGKKNFVEAEFEDGKLFPIRGRSCSTHAIPSLANKIDSYHQFALLELPEIYTAQCLEESERFAATHLESGIFYNDGQGGLRFEKLPSMVQLAPGFGSVVTEVNGDGHPDLYIVQNFYGPQVETGHMDGGMSILLHGDGQGGFEETEPVKTGLVVRKDAKGLGALDLNNDNQVDFVVGRNKDSVLGFRNRATTAGKSVKVRLEGPGGNPTAVGARVSVVLSDDSRQTAEVQAGTGYLSQSTPSLFFGLGEGNTIKEIAVRWPNGEKKSYTGEAVSGSSIVLKP